MAWDLTGFTVFDRKHRFDPLNCEGPCLCTYLCCCSRIPGKAKGRMPMTKGAKQQALPFGADF